jgi:ABC-type xylose transport system permease subunit
MRVHSHLEVLGKSGVHVEQVKMSLFVASGIVAALAGLLHAARLGAQLIHNKWRGREA